MLQPRISKVRPFSNHQIGLEFETGETGVFDVSPYISGDWYGQLSDPGYFRTVHVVDGGAEIAWAGGQDIAPHELYTCARKTPAPM
ncbi:MAG: DUF2442 domain-containing protein [Bifidobacteriaceae bacterium]|jgi:hypothetical protein|nr:DUF2442 domain-containing protein [Bifidobacteriaceae bacterium]